MENRIIQGQYEIKRTLKQGGFGTIYYGLDRVLQRPIAIKEILPHLLGDEKYIKMFRDEALITGKLQHPAICQLYNLVQENVNLYLIMEYIDGIDVSAIIKYIDRPLSGDLCLYIIHQICEALYYAHTYKDNTTGEPTGLIHRDISPSNIMVTVRGDIKLIDFGIAKSKQRIQDATMSGMLKGKLHYMAPEQIRGDTTIDSRVDLFSLGVVLFEMITGTRLFQETTSEYKLMQVIEQVQVDLETQFAKYGLPETIQKIITGCVQKDVSKRYQTAQNIQRDCSAALSSYSIMDCKEKLGELAKKRKTLHDSTKDRIKKLFSDIDDSGISSFTSVSEYIDTENNAGQDGTADIELGEALNEQTLTEVSNRVVEGTKTIGSKENLFKKKHVSKKVVLLLSFICLFVLMLLDALYKWTPIGEKIYALFMPSGIMIVSNPPGAQIFLNGAQTSINTPGRIQNEFGESLHVAVYHPAFLPIGYNLKRLKDGSIVVNNKPLKGEKLLFTFSHTIKISSQPENALVFVNGENMEIKTPGTLAWKYGIPLQLTLRHDGFADLSGFNLENDGTIKAENERNWNIERNITRTHSLSVTGLFSKAFYFRTKPEKVTVYLEDSQTPLGYSNDALIPLSFGEHKIVFKKPPMDILSINFKVTENSAESTEVLFLHRNVYVKAINDMGNSVRAKIATLQDGVQVQRVSRFTPCSLSLPYRKVSIKAIVPGYKALTRTILPHVTKYSIHFETPKSIVYISVRNEQYEGIDGVSIKYTIRGGKETHLIGSTDHTGNLSKHLIPGTYSIALSKAGFETYTSNIAVKAKGKNQFAFILYNK